MGKRLAEEVERFINDKWPRGDLKRLSFIGHSLGGVIIRAALPHLKRHKDKMYSYMSFSSPHLGCSNGSKLISTGIAVIKKWYNSKCLQQLSLSDAKNIKDTFLYKLSMQEGLNWFKNIGLVCSYQDTYSPFDSSRIQVSNKTMNDKQNGSHFIAMASNVLGRLQSSILYRIDVNFHIPKKDFDSIIGRKAHINFLEHQALLRMIIFRYGQFFK